MADKTQEDLIKKVDNLMIKTIKAKAELAEAYKALEKYKKVHADFVNTLEDKCNGKEEYALHSCADEKEL